MSTQMVRWISSGQRTLTMFPLLSVYLLIQSKRSNNTGWQWWGVTATQPYSYTGFPSAVVDLTATGWQWSVWLPLSLIAVQWSNNTGQQWSAWPILRFLITTYSIVDIGRKWFHWKSIYHHHLKWSRQNPLCSSSDHNLSCQVKENFQVFLDSTSAAKLASL